MTSIHRRSLPLHLPGGSLRRLLVPVAVLACAPAAAAVPQGPPPGYYDSVDTTDSNTLRATLHPVIEDHIYFPYTSSSTDTWNVLELAQQDPADASRILTVYSNTSFLKQGTGNSFYQREHTWPNSYGFPDDDGQNLAFTDCHMLWLSDGNYNFERSNKPFRTCSASCEEWTTNVNNGQGGGSGVYPGNSNWSTGSFTQGTWEVWVGRRGDIARTMFYADIRYEGGAHGTYGWAEPDLVLTDDEALIDDSNTGQNESLAYMGILSVLLQWHLEDPVDANEQLRNDTVFSFQQNRNPFVDHPEWVAILYSEPPPPPPPGLPGDPWINELHYDNSGTDQGEFVELAGPAGLDLGGWSLIGYNGNGGGMYQTVALSGQLSDLGSCRGVKDFAFTGLQNGAPDGVALVSPTNEVLEFLSYEGVFVAADGPAAGLTSVDLGVAESSGTPVGFSLQLGGTGTDREDFTWQAEAADTRGSGNGTQVFQDACPAATVYGSGVNPPGSMAVVAGVPQSGTTLTIAVDNPLGTQLGGAPILLFFAFAPDPNYPAGTLVPGFGMAGPGAFGELLISIAPPNPVLSQFGPVWTGGPTSVDILIPGDGSLIGTTVYGQALVWDPFATQGVRFGFTDGVEIPVY